MGGGYGLQIPHPDFKKASPLDFGAAGKGYLVDLVSDILRKNKIDSFCVDAGGDIFYQNKNEERLRAGLENPDNPKQVIGVTTILKSKHLCFRRKQETMEGFHHIISPKTLSSPQKIKGTWVIADTAILADAITTCLFFVPEPP